MDFEAVVKPMLAKAVKQLRQKFPEFDYAVGDAAYHFPGKCWAAVVVMGKAKQDISYASSFYFYDSELAAAADPVAMIQAKIDLIVDEVMNEASVQPDLVVKG